MRFCALFFFSRGLFLFFVFFHVGVLLNAILLFIVIVLADCARQNPAPRESRGCHQLVSYARKHALSRRNRRKNRQNAADE